MKLKGKIVIEGTVEAITGLHVGGNKSSLEIGGVDSNIIKSGNGIPYIPGSSLKGKLRSLLAKVRGSVNVESDLPHIKDLFGNAGGKEQRGITRLAVRDALLDLDAFKGNFGSKQDRIMDFEYSEVKTENTIDRSNGKANPRQIERVPCGAIFNYKMILDIYQGDETENYVILLNEAFQLLNLDYLGGHGSRGSGQVKLSTKSAPEISISEKGVSVVNTTKWLDILQKEALPV